MAEADLTEAQRKSNALIIEHYEKQVTAARNYTGGLEIIGTHLSAGTDWAMTEAEVFLSNSSAA